MMFIHPSQPRSGGVGLVVVLVMSLFVSSFADDENNGTTPSSGDDELLPNTAGLFDTYFCGGTNGNDCGLPFYILLLPLFYGCIVACTCWVYFSEVRIKGHDKKVRASVITREAGYSGGAHDNDVPPRERLSYVYENQNYTVWKNNHRGNILSRCVVYVDPYKPERCVVRGETVAATRIGHAICFSLVGTAMFAFFITIFLVPGIPTIVYWALYGLIFCIPVLCAFCINRYIVWKRQKLPDRSIHPMTLSSGSGFQQVADEDNSSTVCMLQVV
jgi:hypothetical protein